jgi:hypothetical protein
VYPFACVTRGEPQGEVVTIFRRLEGSYEYWIALNSNSTAGEVEVELRNVGGAFVRRWTSRAAESPSAWHVFDLDGENGSVRSVDELLLNQRLPDAAHTPNTSLCPE